jgi:hypothetical protein
MRTWSLPEQPPVGTTVLLGEPFMGAIRSFTRVSADRDGWAANAELEKRVEYGVKACWSWDAVLANGPVTEAPADAQTMTEEA